MNSLQHHLIQDQKMKEHLHSRLSMVYQSSIILYLYNNYYRMHESACHLDTLHTKDQPCTVIILLYII